MSVPEPAWLSPAEQRAWRALLRIQSVVTGEVHRRLSVESGLSLPDYDVLVALSEAAEGRVRPVDLGRSLGWEQSRLSHQVTRMARRKLVTRTGCDTDGRGSWITVTAAGRRAIQAAAPGHVAAVRELIVDALSPAEGRVLEAIAGRIAPV